MRYANKVDKNQGEIVSALRALGVSVEVGHDDILVGYQGKTYWYEIKSPSEVGKNGSPRNSSIKPSQKKILSEFKGHYKIVWRLQQIIDDIGLKIS